MPQTRPNGTVVPINSDEYNLTPDLATMADSIHVVVPVADKAARDALTPFVGLEVLRLDRDGWTQKYTGVNTASGWEYERPSRRVYAVVNSTNLVNEAGDASRVVYTMPNTELNRPYPQTVNVFARIALACPVISGGSVQEWLCVSANQNLVANAQGRASHTFIVSPTSVLETLQAQTGPITVLADTDPLARMWIQRDTASAVVTTVSSDPTFTQMYVDLRPQDD